MYTARKFSLYHTLRWTRKNIVWFAIISALPTLLYYFLEWHWLALPSLPVSLIGTAVAFNIGFKNNNSYSRLWEARKIWGGIVNTSRSWGIMCMDYISTQFTDREFTEEQLYSFKQKLIHRHIAWLTALRHQLRSSKPWEHTHLKDHENYRKYNQYKIKEFEVEKNQELTNLLSESE
ncbi:MAG: bestrophin family ion channel, partial [Bacteroidota bacterium]